jgi:predicted DNA-binding transcriptional regulator YafY
VSSAGQYRTATLIMELVRLVEGAPYQTASVNRLAEKLGVHRRTIRRWARGLEEVQSDDGEPLLRLVPGRPGTEAMVQAPSTHGAASAGDLRALALGLAATRYLAATGAQDLEDYAEGLMARLGRHDPDARARIAHAFHYIPFGAKSYRLKPDEVDAVFSGVIFQRTLEFDYHRPQGEHPLHVRAEPWSLVFYRDALYMLGRRLSYREPVLRTYAIDRMSQVRTDRSARFEVPSDFDPADHFGDLGLWKPAEPRERLELLFTTEVAPLVKERSWPRTVCREETDDGRLRLALDIRISPEVESWLLSYGASVEVVQPTRLRQKMAGKAAAMAELYGSASKVGS